MAQQVQSEIRYLTPPSVDVKKKKYCRFKKSGIKYIDYKDPFSLIRSSTSLLASSISSKDGIGIQ